MFACSQKGKNDQSMTVRKTRPAQLTRHEQYIYAIQCFFPVWRNEFPGQSCQIRRKLLPHNRIYSKELPKTTFWVSWSWQHHQWAEHHLDTMKGPIGEKHDAFSLKYQIQLRNWAPWRRLWNTVWVFRKLFNHSQPGFFFVMWHQLFEPKFWILIFWIKIQNHQKKTRCCFTVTFSHVPHNK